jgi:hypothetical protein
MPIEARVSTRALSLLSDDQKVDVLRLATQRMARLTFPFVASVIRVEADDTGTFCGSAWRTAIADKRFVVTARHVLDEASQGREVTVTARRRSPPWPTPLSAWRQSGTDDLAVFEVSDAYPGPPTGAPDDVAFWPAENIDPSGARIGDDFLFVHGFPQRHARFSPLLGGVVSATFPYGAMQHDEPSLIPALRPHEFAIHFEATGLVDIEGHDAQFVVPHGLSGSAVWRMDIGGRAISTWRPEQAKIVGMVTRWLPDRQALVAIHAHRLMGAFGP